MSKITRYKQSNGRYSVVVENVDLTDDALLLLDNGYPLDVNVEIQDGKKITVKQRKKVFALLNDIEAHTGSPREYMKEMFTDFIVALNGYSKRLSLSDCTRKQAGELIDTIMAWVFQNDIPLNYKTSDLMKNDQTFLYLATVHRKCVICGKYGELAHHKAIGRGANRKKMDHYGYEVLALCREHHQSQHNMGVESFDKLHHLENSWVPVNKHLNDMLKGRK
ncbi:putative HNHc nuclease [Mammaliicoccus vitulinus]|uniref:putative HNHc nuclease n=1 Tax=Mammaliicoccus vitulinus TaxID=71237 RepID=UPI002B25B1E8|nr:putative HNHc nuclease [Mammaliicoccus vitulinus]WQK87061.1 putative HNHc nuclease [Mammaliicoccus vitulinus]